MKLEWLLEYAINMGAEYAAALYHTQNTASITAENGVLKGFESCRVSGIGIRTIVKGALGVASSTIIRRRQLIDTVAQAIKMAKSSREGAERHNLAETKPLKAHSYSAWRITPDDIPDEEKVRIVLEANRESMMDGVKSSISSMRWLDEKRLFASSEGAYVETDVRMVGFAHSAIASAYGILEYVSDSRSQCAGFEFISGADWSDFARKVAETSIKAVKAPSLKPGKYTVVADQDLVGLILHEALGHAAEGDLVSAGESILAGKVGHIVGSKFVTIIDEGVVNGGYYLPYDDEGTEKGRCIVVEGGILKGYLHSRLTANKLGERPTGNARSQDFGHFPMVRQTNFYMDRGDACLEELLDGIKEGIYLRGTGARGGQVDVGQGTFTLRAGPSYIIRGGELSEMVRGVSVSGMVLEALKRVSAVGRDLLVKTSIFGGCGKGEQRVLVGYGGPHVRVEQMSVGSGL